MRFKGRYYNSLIALTCATILHALATISASNAHAQIILPKVDSTRVTYFNHSFDSLFLGKIHYIDTSLLYFSRFDWTSHDEFGVATLSNSANPVRPLFFIPWINYGYDFFHKVYKPYQRSGKDIKFFQPLAPYTELSYLMASKREQQLRVNFSRLVAARSVVGMDYGLISAPGYYKNHFADQSNVYFTARHQTPNERYGIGAWYFHNKLLNNENGGIENDSIFENRLLTDRRLFGVNLQDAKNKIKLSGFGFEQYFILLPPTLHTTNDSLPAKRRFQLGRLTHRFEYLRNQWVYTERFPMEKFYRSFDPVLDSGRTYDSTYQTAFINRLQWSSLGYRKHISPPPLHLYAGIELVNILQSDTLQALRYFQVNPYGGLAINLLNSLFIDGRFKVVGGDWAGGDVYLEGNIKQFLGTLNRNLGNLYGQIQLANQSASWFDQRYFSNHFRWQNNFDKSNFLRVEGGYHFKGLSTGLVYNLLNKPVYHGAEAKPAQFNGTLNVLQLYSKLHLTPGHFDIIGRFLWQYADNTNVLRLPNLLARLRLLYTIDAFHKAATIQAGIDAMYHSAYLADAWMPALRTFYLQNNKKVGNYPYIDAHIAIKLKRARVFFQATNLFGLTGNHYYFTTPAYPMRDQRFCLGVNWRFYN